MQISDSTVLDTATTAIENITELKETQLLIHTKRQLYADKYYESNNYIINQLFSTSLPHYLKSQLLTGSNIWIGQYSPIIKLSLTKDEINRIKDSDFVEAIYLDDYVTVLNETTIEPQSSSSTTSMSVWKQTTNVTYLNNLGFDGSGIKVGLYDVGVLRYDDTAMKNYKASFTDLYNDGRLIADPAAPTEDPSHAAYCGSIIAGSSTNGTGVAPGVTLYSTTGSNRTGAMEGAMEWLISQDVNVISISVGWSTYNTYDYISQWLDHIAVQHEITVVISAGNQGSTDICGGGMSYNSITVGASDDKNTISRTDDTVADFSSYNSNSSLGIKPDIVAPGCGIMTPVGANGGTSLSTPIVAGIIALIYEMRPGLTSQQQVTKSVLLAGISDCGTSLMAKSTVNSTAIAMKQNAGAGLVDGRGARWVAADGRYVGGTFNSSTTTYTKTYTVAADEKLTRISLAWAKYNRLSGNHGSYNEPTNPSCALLYLQVTTPSGKVYKSHKTTGNVQNICFVPTEAGTYTIKVTKISAPSSEPYVHFGLSWY